MKQSLKDALVFSTIAALGLLAMTSCAPVSTGTAAPNAAALVQQGQQAVQAAGAGITAVAAGACLAASVLDVASGMAAATHNAGDAVTLSNAGTASKLACNWSNPPAAQ